ncbi:nuclease [Aeropyrum globular virus 1]|uniref:nuclease n=1 Tax=Aeropyrum globular virus 1 TaxID=1932713 RepID=UPI000C7EAB9D|nr:nuclease [Aeropyrum globular virus 1]BBC20946.1 nuclease [Aeropyrum globular virus 1]
MTVLGLDARDLKQRYKNKWSRSNAREQFVLAALQAYLPPGFEARLTGLGAGSSEYIEHNYKSLEEAFDITVYYMDRPVAFLDVTGVVSVLNARRAACNGRCVGSWKLRKAEKHRVLGRVWFAWVNDQTASIYFLPAAWLAQHAEGPHVSKCRLYSDERIVYCVRPGYWKKLYNFLRWLAAYGPVADYLTPF